MSAQLLDVFGNDLMVVNAARVSLAKESHEFSLQDEKLVMYLAKHKHISPFFHPQIQFRLKMPIFVAREWFRHTIGFSRNEVSRRYVDSPPEFFMPSDLLFDIMLLLLEFFIMFCKGKFFESLDRLVNI